MAAPTPPKRSILIAARLITAVVSLAGAEAVLWLGGYPRWWAMDPQWGTTPPEYESNSVLGWQNREGRFNLAWPGLAGTTLVTNWSHGRRATAEREPAGDTNRPRVFFFGDSFMQGYELSDSQTMPWIVQHHHPELNVSNFGTGDYATYQSYLAIKKWVHGPASVYHLFNDFHEGRNAADPNWLRVYKKTRGGFFFPYTELTRAGDLPERKSEGDLVWPLSRHLRTVAMIQDYRDMWESLGRVRKKRQLTETLLVKMNEAVRAEGGIFTVMLVDMTPEERNDYRKFLGSQNIRFIDCDHPELKDRKLRLPDGHPDEALNELFAQWIEPLQVVTNRGAEARSLSERQ